MTDIFSEMQGIASGILAEFNQGSLEYVSMTPGGGPPDNPGAPTPTYTPINSVARGVSSKYVDSANIVATDLQLTMPADGIEPTLDGFIRSGSTRYKIVAVKRVPPFGTAVVYIVIFRK